MNSNIRQKSSAFFMLIALYRQAQSLGLLRPGGAKPLFTLALLGVCFVVHFFTAEVAHLLPFSPSLYASCVSAPSVWYDRQYGRLLWAGLLHADDMYVVLAVIASVLPRRVARAAPPTLALHLYYNAMSMLWKGVQLEGDLGTPVLALASLVMLLATHALMVGAAFALWAMDSTGGGYGASAMQSCAVGISGLLFAWKTLLNERDARAGRTHASVMGFAVPLRWVSWAELVLISLITPNASFLGHLCGIVTGLLYIALTDLLAPEYGVGRRHHQQHRGGGGGGGCCARAYNRAVQPAGWGVAREIPVPQQPQQQQQQQQRRQQQQRAAQNHGGGLDADGFPVYDARAFGEDAVPHQRRPSRGDGAGDLDDHHYADVEPPGAAAPSDIPAAAAAAQPQHHSAAAAAAAAAASQPSQPAPAMTLTEQVQQLVAMGFRDRAHNARVLRAHGNDLNAAIAALTSGNRNA